MVLKILRHFQFTKYCCYLFLKKNVLIISFLISSMVIEFNFTNSNFKNKKNFQFLKFCFNFLLFVHSDLFRFYLVWFRSPLLSFSLCRLRAIFVYKEDETAWARSIIAYWRYYEIFISFEVNRLSILITFVKNFQKLMNN